MNPLIKNIFNTKDAEHYYNEAYNFETNQHQYKKALGLYIKAANLGLAKAQYYAGYMHLHGRGLNGRSVEKALVLIEKAAQQNYAPAQLLMSKIYSFGKFVPINEELSIYWMQKFKEHNLENEPIIGFHSI